MMNQSTPLSKRLAGLLLALCVASVFLATPSLAASSGHPTAPTETIINYNITTDTTWGIGQSPYYVVTETFIEPGVTLTIEPGVQVLFGKNSRIHVGRDGVGGAAIIAKGTSSQPIEFTRHDPTYRWKNIRHYEGSTSYYRHVKFHWGGETEAPLIYLGAGTHVLNNCIIRYSNRQGIVAIGSGLDLRIAGTLITDNKRYGILTDSGATIHITGSEIDQHDSIGIYMRSRTIPSTITVSDSNLLNIPGTYSIYNEMFWAACINAQNNWWGAASGPYDKYGASDACGSGSTNAGSGSDVCQGQNYSNWRTTAAPLVGITTPPVAAFTITPDNSVPRPPTTVFTVDASGSTDVEDYTSSLEFCWDWENSGSCTTWLTTPSTTHTFSSGGWKTVRLVVRDTDSDTDEMTQDIQLGYPPTASFVYTQTTWSEVVFDASTSSDVEDGVSSLLAQWDWESDGTWDTSAISVTDIQTYTYPHLGRFWPTLEVEDTDSLTDMASKTVDIIPPAVFTTVTGSGSTLISTDTSVQIGLYTDTMSSDVISNGLVITHTPWLTLPHPGLEGLFTYQGFTLSAQSSDGQPVTEVTGTYTITLTYPYTYFTDVVGLPPFEDKLVLYHWSGTTWELVTFTLNTTDNQLVATVDSFGEFALVMDARRVYLPLIMKSY